MLNVESSRSDKHYTPRARISKLIYTYTHAVREIAQQHEQHRIESYNNKHNNISRMRESIVPGCCGAADSRAPLKISRDYNLDECI